jgi:uncharacterized protein
MEELFEIFAIKLRNVPMQFTRSLAGRINWNHRLICVLGARGVGKTTLLLQHIKNSYARPSKEVLYVDVSHIYFTNNSLIDLADQFYKMGGKYLYLDEIHKYPRWSSEIKQIHDTYAELNLVITGSSILEIEKGEADLSRRMVRYFLFGLSFREYLLFTGALDFAPFDMVELVENHTGIAEKITSKIRPLAFFEQYLSSGYYPYFIEGTDVYHEKLRFTINQVIDTDVPAAEPIDFHTLSKMKKLLYVISSTVPFKPNTQKLADLLAVSRPTLLKLFDLLSRAQLIQTLNAATKGLHLLAKPEKIYLNNPNLMFAFSPTNADTGTIRETFFMNQLLNSGHVLHIPNKGDFLVDNTYVFEVGGRKKSIKQIEDISLAWVAADGIEIGINQRIPLWMFGFLY